MATREETRRRREALYAHLLEAARTATGQGSQGRATESVRALAARFELSPNSVLGVQRELARKGVLKVVPRSGAFAQPDGPRRSDLLFLLVYGASGEDTGFAAQLSRAFQNAVSTLGVSALTLEWNVAHALLSRGEVPRPAGIFDMSPRLSARSDESKWSELNFLPQVPRVCYANHRKKECDTLSFDDEGGGYMAARHLLESGCERIAFVGLDESSPDQLLEWSRGRELGWLRAMREAGLPARDLAIHPSDAGQLAATNRELDDEPHYIEAGRLMAREVAQRLQSGDAIEGVIAANDPIAHGLLGGLQALNVPAPMWPAIVGFDADPRFSGQFLTSLRLSTDDLCRVATDLLWARATNAIKSTPQHRLVPMKLILRLSCQTRWLRSALQSDLRDSVLTPVTASPIVEAA